MSFKQNRKIKICHVTSVDITVKFLLLPQLEFLINEGYDVSVVCSSGKWTKDIEERGIRVKNIKITRKITPILDLISLFRLFLYFRKEKFDIVHVHTPKAGVLGQLAAKLAGVPIIINTVHGLYFNSVSSPLVRNFYIFIKRVAAKCSDLIFSQNKEDIKTLVAKKIAKLEKIKYLGNGVDVKKFNSERFSKDFILNKKKGLGLDPDYKVIGVIGRLVKEKGYLEVFEAFKLVLEKFPRTVLLVIGPEDPEKKDALSLAVAKNYGIENNIIFLGERADVDELYSLMDVFVLASHREGFPRTVIEAMAMRRPIIATDIRGCREAIDNGKNGILVPAKNSNKLKEAIIFLLENKHESENMAQSARDKAEIEFSEKSVFSKIKGEYEKLLQKKVFSKDYKSRISQKNIGSSKIKLCHVATVDITIRFILWDLLKFFKKRNYNVSIACSPGKWVELSKREGFSVYNVKMLRRISPFADLIPLVKLFLFFKKEKFDIVHTHTPKAGVLGRIAARLAGVPVVIHSSHGFYTGIKIDPGIKMVILFAEKISSYFCDLVTFLNKEDVDFAIKKRIVNPKKIKLLAYGIDIERFSALKFNHDFISSKKKALGIENKRVIGMVGRFVEEKGYLDLFRAFKTVKDRNSDVVLLLVAPPDRAKEDALNYSVLKDYGIEKQTIILGSNGEIDKIEEIYSLMDIFVLPSYREGFPYSIMEASSMGKPVIATDIRGCREAIENGITGILVPPENFDKLAQSIVYLLDNPKKADELGKNGRRKAEKEFDERLFFDRMEKEYSGLLKRKVK